MKRRALIAIIVAFGVTWEAHASPCTGVNRDMTSAQQTAYAEAIQTQLKAPKIDILATPFRSGRWIILYVNTHQSDETYVFFSDDPTTTHYTTLWGGAAAMDEGPEIKQWVLKNAPGIPEKLAACFAYNVTHDDKN